MSLFRFNWLRRFVRRNTHEIPENRAALWKQRLSVVYAVIAWNAFGFVGYMIYKGKGDWANYYGLKTEEEMNMSPGHQWVKTLNLQGAEVYRIKGFSLQKVEEKETMEKNENNSQV
ncbi:uncharacterized protein LOC126880501 [Diabrotica virgifera virgifera]|uniref:Uncharacterized protein n=1 Tax=Diabrotica virgifera virgifera TaxID=50390 RepID=A0ABM5JQX5_DIAVI|nr:uncharacterized protein LOC126880501 [Diabrotica virgifera virgifera]